ncbi:MAG: response regulator transcription factor, partial [Dehalococcoidales bacterium]|nr:response regulator transcription factor [Dehalococcoidales bacterium]
MSGERVKIIKVLLADDHILIRAGLKALLEEKSDIHVVDEASNGVEAVSSFIKHKPDVVILDISMPVMDGLETCKQLKKIDSEAKILILSVYNEQQYATRALVSGASGYINKQASQEELYKAIRCVADGQFYLAEGNKDIILSKLLHMKGQHDLIDTLSDRELQVLRLLSQGKGIKEIASYLGLSIKTIDNYRYRVMTKLNLNRTVDLVIFAHNH